MKQLCKDRLKKLMHYDPNTGLFTRIKKISNNGQVKLGPITSSLDASGYKRTSVERKRYRLHRLAFLYMTGEIPKLIDHVNRDKTDNRWCNLRSATSSLNARNSSMKKSNTSGTIGVHKHSTCDRWAVQIMVKGKRINLGLYKELQTAITVRKAAEGWWNYAKA